MRGLSSMGLPGGCDKRPPMVMITISRRERHPPATQTGVTHLTPPINIFDINKLVTPKVLFCHHLGTRVSQVPWKNPVPYPWARCKTLSNRIPASL
jgi:hypothetical protein